MATPNPATIAQMNHWAILVVEFLGFTVLVVAILLVIWIASMMDTFDTSVDSQTINVAHQSHSNALSGHCRLVHIFTWRLCPMLRVDHALVNLR